jgi:dipeptidyl aminopeptidase/acylaminoacyl peptidase
MADDPITTPDNSPDPTEIAAPPRRKVYQPTLFPERHRRRVSPWLVFPLLLLVFGGLLFALISSTHHVRFVHTTGEIVYSSDVGSPSVPHLWVCRFDGSQAHRLLTGTASDSEPAFAPGGSRLAFISNRDGKVNQIFMVDGDGEGLVEITRSADAKTHPQWSSGNPGMLGYTAGGALYEMTVSGDGSSGGADRVLPPPPNTRQAQDTDPALSQGPAVSVPAFAWSPAKNGGVAAIEDNGEVQVLALSSGVNSTPVDVRTTPQGAVPLLSADTISLGWSPDGSLLAVGVLGIQGLPTPGSGIVLFEPDGTQAPGRPPFAVPNASLGPQNPVFSPDGTEIVFEAWSEPNLASLRRLGLYAVPVDGSSQPRLLYRGDTSKAQFAPDGSTIFFLLARKSGGHDLCRIGLDGTGFQRLSSDSGDVTGFSISPQTSQ